MRRGAGRTTAFSTGRLPRARQTWSITKAIPMRAWAGRSTCWMPGPAPHLPSSASSLSFCSSSPSSCCFETSPSLSFTLGLETGGVKPEELAVGLVCSGNVFTKRYMGVGLLGTLRTRGLVQPGHVPTKTHRGVGPLATLRAVEVFCAGSWQ